MVTAERYTQHETLVIGRPCVTSQVTHLRSWPCLFLPLSWEHRLLSHLRMNSCLVLCSGWILRCIRHEAFP